MSKSLFDSKDGQVLAERDFTHHSFYAIITYMEKHPLHIKIPELQQSEEVEKAVEKKERLEDVTLPNDPKDRIEAYMDRLENIFLNPDERVRERNLDMLRDKIYDTLVIKPEQVPESYFELQQQVARERGQTVEHIPQDVRDQMIETVIADQKHSLDQWIEYLTSDDVAYPTWFKYFVWRNIIKLSQFDKTLGKFKTRTESTVAPYPDIYRAPLARILDIYEEALKDKTKSDKEVQEDFTKKFSKLYAELITESLAVTIESKEEIRGEWVKYNKGNQGDADNLFNSMQAKGTGWCVEGRTTARNYINQGDFYVFYTYNEDNEPTQPRIAIQMNGNQIGQIRGIQEHQELEPVMQDILDKKLQGFGSEADSYRKKSEDMRRMTEIEKKTKSNTPLTKEDLRFLYEMDSKIEGFGYDTDPRIEEIRKSRDSKEDMLTIFDCTEEEVATIPEEVTEQTKAYLGPWSPTIYNKLQNFPHIQHLYESFPDKPIFKYELHTDPNIDLPQKAEEELKAKGVYVSDWGHDILQKTEFSHEGKTYNLVQFTVGQLGFPRGATTAEIYAKAKELGLDLCPAEVGPHLRLSYTGSDWKFIAMEQITDRNGNPDVFDLYRDGGELELHGDDARPDDRWHGNDQFVFLSRK